MNIQEIIAGHKLTIKFSRTKYEEILKNLSATENSEESESDNQDENQFNEKIDLKEQAKMLKNIIEEQEKKAAAELGKLTNDEQKNNNSNQEQEILEDMIRVTLKDEESKKLKELLEKIEAKNINSAIENILHPCGNEISSQSRTR